MSSSILKRLLKRYTSGSANRTERYLIDRWYSSFGDQGERTPGLETEELSARTKERMFSKISIGISKPARLWYRQPAVGIAASLLIVTTLALLELQ